MTTEVGVARPGVRSSHVAMLLSASLCLVASLVLSIDAVKLAADPTAALSCNINSVLNCGTVALSSQASLLGFPNAFLGLICEPVIITVALAGLAGVRFPRWFMAVAQVVYLAGLVFALWLFQQSAFVIGALCPWCLVITVGTTVTFFSLLRVNILQHNFPLPDGPQGLLERAVALSLDRALAVLLVAAVAAVIFVQHGAKLLGL